MMFALAITGPTASGKTALSLELAKKLGLEIICLDSMQIYKDMNIGTAKPTEKERALVPHHVVDFLPFSENYNAESYRADAMRAVRDITSRGKIPLFVGGTGLYIDTLTGRGENGAPASDREYIEGRASAVRGPSDVHALWLELERIDPESAAAIHENNVKRVLRALEIYEKSGKTKTYFDNQSKKKKPELDIGMITLDFHKRELLYERADTRVDEMMREGLLAEVEGLARRGLFDGDTTASQAIGYKELGAYLRGAVTLDEAVTELKTATRRYAKRQLTWFRHEREAYRLFADTEDGVMRSVEELLAEAYSFAMNFIKNKNVT